MNLVKRIENLEKYFGADVDPGAEALIIFTVDASRNDAPPLPITKFLFQGHEIHREPGEPYPTFETRAVKEAFNLLPAKQPGCRRPMPVPCLIADGSLQE